MKNKVKPIYHILLFITFSFSYGNQVFGQEKVNISAGIGLPELLNIGVRYQLDQAQIGLSIGSMPVKDESLISLSGDFYYHFGGSSKFSDIRPWYGRIGLNYVRDETETSVDKYLYLILRIGRDFNLSKKFGINIDAGLGPQLFHDEIMKKPSTSWFNLDFEFPVIPALGICLFYRI